MPTALKVEGLSFVKVKITKMTKKLEQFYHIF